VSLVINNASSFFNDIHKPVLGLIGLIIATSSSKQWKITMQDRYLCCPPYFFLGPAVATQFFHSRIATDYLTIFGEYKHWFAALDGKRFVLSDIAQDLPIFTDMHVPTLVRMLNVLQLLVLDQLSPTEIAYWAKIMLLYVTRAGNHPNPNCNGYGCLTPLTTL